MRHLVAGGVQLPLHDGDLQIYILGVRQQHLSVGDCLLRGEDAGLRLGQLGLGHGELPRADARPHLRQSRFGHSDTRLGGLNLRVEDGRVQLQEQLTGRHQLRLRDRNLGNETTKLSGNSHFLSLDDAGSFQRLAGPLGRRPAPTSG